MLYFAFFVLEILILFFTSRYIYQALYLFFYKIFRNRNAAAIPVFILFMPGVFIHELAHFLVAEILFVKVYDFEVSPKIEEGMLKMGSVQVAKSDPIRRALIGVAPVIVGVLVMFAVLYMYMNSFDVNNVFSTPLEIGKLALVLWATFFITNTMFSSKKDLEGTLGLLVALIFLAIVITVTAFILKINFWDPAISFIANSRADYLKPVVLLFLIPVGVNIVIFLIARLTTKRIF
ncbi:MAG TPA: hypothetical protein VG917_05975 [Patescibacteria group bacterium]|nr:hypothetical protein [Patescibacteria group bacterium]